MKKLRFTHQNWILACLCLSLAFCSCNKIEKETEDIAIRNIGGVPVTQEVTTMMEDYFSKMDDRIKYLEATVDWLVHHVKPQDSELTEDDIDALVAENLEDYRKEERQWFREYVENYVSENVHCESSVDPEDLEQVYVEIGELQKQIHEIENGVEKLYELKKRMDSHDETIASILKQLDSITDDIDKIIDAGVGPECEGIEGSASEKYFDEIFKRLEKIENKIKEIEWVIRYLQNQQIHTKGKEPDMNDRCKRSKAVLFRRAVESGDKDLDL